MVNDIGFAKLMNYVRPKFRIPSRSHFTESVMPNVYKHIKSTVKYILSTATALSLTTDGWRALNKDEFISLTAHCVYPNFEQQVLVLHTKPFHDSHTAVNINEMVNTMIDDFSIPPYKVHNVIHDNASNMTSAIGGLSEYNSLPCFIHTTQLVVDNAVLQQPSVATLINKSKKIGNYLSHSTNAYRRLAQIQRELGRPVRKYINEVATRWDSEYNSLVRVKEMKVELTLLLSELHEEFGVTIHNSEWDLLERLVSLLQIFQQLTVKISDRYANASIIIP